MDQASYLFSTANVVLKNLTRVENPDYAAKIVDNLKGTSCELQMEAWAFADSFHKQHQKFPAWEVVKARYPNAIEEVEIEWSDDFMLELMVGLQRERTNSEATTQLAEGNLEKAAEILQSMPTLEKKRKYTARDSLEEYQKIKALPSGILLGIKELDDTLKGIAIGTVAFVAAPPSMFKTAMMVSATYNNVMMPGLDKELRGFNILIITLEVKKEHLWFHLLSRHSNTLGKKIPAQSMIKGLMTEEEEEFFEKVVDDWETNVRGQLEIWDATDFSGGLTFASMSAEFLRLDSTWQKEKKGGLDAIWADYLQLWKFYRGRMESMDFLNDVVRYFGNLSITFRGSVHRSPHQVIVNLVVSQS